MPSMNVLECSCDKLFVLLACLMIRNFQVRHAGTHMACIDLHGVPTSGLSPCRRPRHCNFVVNLGSSAGNVKLTCCEKCHRTVVP